jgi:hypothetical protein
VAPLARPGRGRIRVVPSKSARRAQRRLSRFTVSIQRAATRWRWLPSYRGALWQLALVAGAIAVIGTLAGLLFVIGFSLGAVGRDFTQGLAFSIGSAVVFGVAGALYFAGWTRRRATRGILKLGREKPAEIFDAPSLSRRTEIVGRQGLIEQIATDLKKSFRAGPVIVVGETGVGKTSLLLGLARYFAERGVVPVGVSLRGLAEPDLIETARTRFVDQVDPYVRSSEEAERLWRSLCLRGQLVILADDLDAAQLDAPGDHQRSATRTALSRARDRGLPLVVTSRREGVPAIFEKSVIELEDLALDDEEAARYVLQQAGRPGDPKKTEQVAALIRAGLLRENPFYLAIAADLIAEHELPEPLPAGTHATRVALLEKYREGLVAEGRIAADPRLPSSVRETALRQLETLAALHLVSDRDELRNRARLKPPSNAWLALDVGERLGLVEIVDAAGTFRFRHHVLHAYLASRAVRAAGQRRLRPSNRLRDELIALEPSSPVVQLALILASAATSRARDVREMCERLLSAAKKLPDDAVDEQLAIVAAAIEAARAADYRELDAVLAEMCVAVRPPASRLAKLAAVRQLADLPTETVGSALWAYAGDDDYGVRWAAANALVSAGPEAYLALAETCFEPIFRRAEVLVRAETQIDDWEEPVASLKTIAWILPALCTASKRAAGHEQTAQAAQAALARLLALEGTIVRDGAPRWPKPITQQRGFESSIAQGFKVDALKHPDKPIDSDAFELLERAAFWYSRVNLVQAISLRARAADRSGQKRARKRIKAHKKRRRSRGAEASALPWAQAGREPKREHPFVRAAAKLALGGLNDRASTQDEKGNAFVWDDEGVVVSRRPERLHRDASQLVGDISVLLNMNEAGDEAQRQQFGTRDILPHCFSGSRNRGEIFGMTGEICEEGCAFKLCPYRPVSGRKSAHRELSRAFCRHQRTTARRRTARRWGSHVGRAALHEFWEKLEYLARV